ncbi:hypothetical protein Goklo_024164 [Gossypium klotzschianum]|uniref:Myb/SANT-like domain-containing protein n=1 Tax=Gossypium klotzschianum TaxID=34286 RepID=A0A7J8W6T0_9ROSI|nr:hypothetical protein [Gossypium klotzschianum]
MVDLYNVGIYNANMGFKAVYLNELERMLEKVLPHAMLKAKPNLESRISSNFGWDEHRQMVIAEDAVRNSYISDVDIANNAKDVDIANNLEERNNYCGCEYDISLDDMDVSATQSQLPKRNQDGSTSSKKKKDG